MKSQIVLVLLLLAISVTCLGQNRQSQLKHGNWAINSLSFANDGKMLISASFDGTIARWNLITGKRIGFLDLDEKKSENNYTISHIYKMDVSPKENVIAISYNQTSVVKGVAQNDTTYRTALVDAETLRVTTVLQNARSETSFSPDGKVLVTIGSEKIARIWSSNEGKEIRQFPIKELGTPLFTPDGQRFIVATRVGAGSTGSMVVAYDLSSNKIVQEIPVRYGSITGVAVSPDGETIAIGGYNGGDYSLKLWSLSDSDRQNPLDLLNRNSDAGYNIVFSPDSKLLASSGLVNCCERVVIRRVQGNKVVKTLLSSGDIESIAFSPDGNRIAYGTEEGDIFIVKV